MRLAWLMLVPLLLVPSVGEARVQKKKSRTQRKTVQRQRHHHASEDERPVATYTHGGMPNIQAEAAVVIDLGPGTELYAKNADAVRPIASISKLMAMMVVLDRKLDLDAATVISDDDRQLARHGARSRLPVGSSFTNRDLLHAALMASDNRAVPALGRAVGYDPGQMASAMNQKAKALGLKNTSFGDPTGLDNRNQSTSREVARMLMAALQVPLISEITRKATYVATSVGGKARQVVEYTNTDVITRSRRFSVLGGKTGYTDRAGYCLAIAAKLDATRDVAMVFLGAPGKMTRFGDFSRAAQWIAEKRPAKPTAPATSATAAAGTSTGKSAAAQ